MLSQNAGRSGLRWTCGRPLWRRAYGIPLWMSATRPSRWVADERATTGGVVETQESRPARGQLAVMPKLSRALC